MSSSVHLHILTLDCDTPVPNVLAERGKYSDIFASLLRDAASKTNGLERLELRFTVYDCVLGELPSEAELKDVNGVIITGSSASAYDATPWIQNLAQWTSGLYYKHPEVKIFGSCFGHQLLCHALFSTPSHPVVEKDPSGWELGVHPITLSPAFLARYGSPSSSHPDQLNLQFVHADHVLHPVAHEMWVREGWESIGKSENCGLQGVWRKGRVLTYQGHAEFDRFINTETIKVFGGKVWEDEFMSKALNQVDRDDDAIWAAAAMLEFFMESPVKDVDGVVGEGLRSEELLARL
ncbi:class I glutamine amidotransferase-like protein [Bisporella sp. PMI_857]|nr:class I glutamine amidotransferase-like protein [Bisporella sp. PMI_857]